MSDGGLTMLPTKPQTRETLAIDPLSARVLLAGMPKVGKSTLLSQWAPQTTLIIDTHRGTTLLDGEHYVQHVRNWQEFEETVDLIAGGRHQFKTVGIDLIDDIYKMADLVAAQKSGQVAAGLIEYGKGTAEAEGLFRRAVSKLFTSPYGIWFLSHTDQETVKRKGRPEQTRYVPRLDKKVRTYVEGACQFIFLAENLNDRRQLRTRASAEFGAGSRVPLPSPMPLDARILYAAMRDGLRPATSATVAPDEVAPDEDPTAQPNPGVEGEAGPLSDEELAAQEKLV
jgi:hypothetical protein